METSGAMGNCMIMSFGNEQRDEQPDIFFNTAATESDEAEAFPCELPIIFRNKYTRL